MVLLNLSSIIHRKQVPLLHSTVLILCYEGDRLVGLLSVFFSILGRGPKAFQIGKISAVNP